MRTIQQIFDEGCKFDVLEDAVECVESKGGDFKAEIKIIMNCPGLCINTQNVGGRVLKMSELASNTKLLSNFSDGYKQLKFSFATKDESFDLVKKHLVNLITVPMT